MCDIRPNKNNGVFQVTRPTEKFYVEIADRKVFITNLPKYFGVSGLSFVIFHCFNAFNP